MNLEFGVLPNDNSRILQVKESHTTAVIHELKSRNWVRREQEIVPRRLNDLMMRRPFFSKQQRLRYPHFFSLLA